MNISLITARLTCDPFRFSSFGRYCTEMRVNFLHSKNYLAKATIVADGKIGASIKDFYYRGDYILIEGECLVVENKSQNTSLVIYVTDVQPAYLNLITEE